jgi:hypothetical protein
MVLSLTIRTSVLLVPLLLAQPAVGQDRPRADGPETNRDEREQWQPLGQIPVDQAGAGRRGYVLAGEGTDVTAPGASQVSFHTVAANNFYREQTTDFLLSERDESHTVAVGYRRGFSVPMFSRVEIGGQIQLTERDSGFLNGFISGFENFWTSLTGSTSAKNQLRTDAAARPPLGTVVIKNGQPLYLTTGHGSGFGDFSVVAKVLLLGGTPTSSDTHVAARVAVNVSGKSEFTEGNFAGVGLGVDRKLSRWAAFHGDVRAALVMDRQSQWGLPLKRGSLGFSVGPEVKLARNTSFSVQYDGSTTPYLPSGTTAFDTAYGDISFGLAHRFRAAGRDLLTQVYARENMDLPLRVRWNTDPDLSLGMKITILTARR